MLISQEIWRSRLRSSNNVIRKIGIQKNGSVKLPFFYEIYKGNDYFVMTNESLKSTLG